MKIKNIGKTFCVDCDKSTQTDEITDGLLPETFSHYECSECHEEK